MNDKRMTENVVASLAEANPVPAVELIAAARSAQADLLLGRILSSEPYPDGRRRAGAGLAGTRTLTRKIWLGTGAATVAVAAAIAVYGQTAASNDNPAASRPDAVAGGRSSVRPAHLVDFSRRDGSIVVKITDPDAPSSQLNAIFRAHGLEIKVNVIPVSPSLAGTIVYSDVQSTRELRDGNCDTGGGGGCWVGFIVPASFTRPGNVTVGRAAHPGEQYESTASVFGPGEALQGSGLVGKPAADALPVLRVRHLTVRWMVNGLWTHSPATPDGLISDGMGWNSTTVVIDVHVPGAKSPGPPVRKH
jgi:hypothetical protein